MNFFPSIVIDNPYHIGDNVILEPVCSQLGESLGKIYLLSDHSELFVDHPIIEAKPRDWDGIDSRTMRFLDFKDALRSMKISGTEQIVLPSKLERIYKAAGLSPKNLRKPQLYLSEEEQEAASEFRSSFTGPVVGVALGSRYPIKTWPNTDALIRQLLKQNINVVAIGKPGVDGEYSYLHDKQYRGLFHLTNVSLRRAMTCIAGMDLVVGPDTGLLHIAGALDVPIVVVGYGIWEDLYEPYTNADFVAIHGFQTSLKKVSTWSVNRLVKSKLAKGKQSNSQSIGRRKGIAVLQLEGLGGTVGLIDHAEKIHAITGEKPYVVARKYEELFENNPHIRDVLTVGMVQYEECIPKIVRQFKTVAVVKTGVGRWFGELPDLDYPKDKQWEDLFAKYPIGTKRLEAYDLNFIQTANLSLGLPYDEISVAVRNFQEVDEDLPERFIVVTNGVDTWHKGLKQTKSWIHEHWESLVAFCDLPVLQVGTNYDRPIDGAVDLCGKTSIPQLLTLLSRASAIICTEGGLMHLAYAVGNLNAIILRGPTRGTFFHYPGLVYVDSFVCKECYWDTGDWYKDCPREIDAACMKSITPERVLANLERMLDENMVQDPQPLPLQLGDSMEPLALGIQ